MKKLILGLLMISVLLVSVGFAFAAKPTEFDNNGKAVGLMDDTGFDEFGYNRVARIFSGTGWSWCMGKVGDEAWCTDYLGPYRDDKLVMKWNAEWDRGNDEGWTDPNGYDAWCNNQWNGMADGSGEIWHYQYKWIGPCGAYGTQTENGGYCIWNQFEVSLSHGTFDGQHFWDSHAIPTGYGA